MKAIRPEDILGHLDKSDNNCVDISYSIRDGFELREPVRISRYGSILLFSPKSKPDILMKSTGVILKVPVDYMVMVQECIKGSQISYILPPYKGDIIKDKYLEYEPTLHYGSKSCDCFFIPRTYISIHKGVE